jgi:hypothetical protein
MAAAGATGAAAGPADMGAPACGAGARCGLACPYAQIGPQAIINVRSTAPGISVTHVHLGNPRPAIGADRDTGRRISASVAREEAGPGDL